MAEDTQQLVWEENAFGSWAEELEQCVSELSKCFKTASNLGDMRKAIDVPELGTLTDIVVNNGTEATKYVEENFGTFAENLRAIEKSNNEYGDSIGNAVSVLKNQIDKLLK